MPGTVGSNPTPLAKVEQMSVRRPGDISVEPEAILRNFRVFETETGDHHFAGYNTVIGEGRVSSKIIQWNPDTKMGITRSGRRYRLDGPYDSLHDDASYIWSVWCKHNHVTTIWKDVTNQYVATI
jgi:hypothetical protein